MSDQVLITGGAGFIGFQLATALQKDGYQVCLVDNYSRGTQDSHLRSLLEKDRVQFIQADLLDPRQVADLGTDFSTIFHLAAIIGVQHVLRRPYEVITHNARMLDNVIELAGRQSQLSRLLFASTSEVYAGTLKHFQLEVPTPETSPLALTSLSSPRTSYMLSKIVGEAMLHQSELPFTIFRPHNIFGPRMGMSHVIPEQLRNAFHAEEGGVISIHSPGHRRAFCYIDDAVEMLIRMMRMPEAEGKTLNLGLESPEVTIREVVETCVDVVGKQLILEDLPDTEGSPSRRAPDMTTSSRLIQFQASTSLREGIQRTWQLYHDHVFATGGVSAQ